MMKDAPFSAARMQDYLSHFERFLNMEIQTMYDYGSDKIHIKISYDIHGFRASVKTAFPKENVEEIVEYIDIVRKCAIREREIIKPIVYA